MTQKFDNSLGIEQIKYNPHNPNYLASCQKNGSVSIWDQRQQVMPVLDFNVDLRSAMCLDWHPNQSHVLLTGGQDNTIKVWNLIDNIEKKK